MWMNLNPAMIAWIPNIKKAGFRLGILSNMGFGCLTTCGHAFPGWPVRLPYFFRDLGDCQTRSRIYLHTVKKLGAAPDQALSSTTWRRTHRRGGCGAARRSFSECRTTAGRSEATWISLPVLPLKPTQ